jgi:hypothetical protein
MERELVLRAVKAHSITSYPNVVGYSNQLMPRIRKGRVIHEEKCVRIYVAKKVPEHQLKPSEVIPKALKLEDGKEVCTDVVEIGVLRKVQQLDPKQRYRPSPTGVSTGRADEVSAGTIGWYVVTENGDVLAISNNHVWARENLGRAGDPLVQPGRLDGGDPEKDVVFTLAGFIPIDFAGAQNTVDVAVATPVSYADVYMSILNIGGVTGRGIPEVNEKVRKMGRTTGVTEGTVIDTSATVRVLYDRGEALFADVALVEDSIKAGDSGSPVLTSKGEFAGLLFAGSDTVFVFCKYNNIEAQLSQKLGKKVFTLVANSYPPFFRETVVQVVQADYRPLLSVLLIAPYLLMPIMVVRDAWRQYSKT